MRKTSLLAIVTLFVTAHSSFGQNLVPDGGFENWNGSAGGYMAPLYDWTASNGTPDHHHQSNPLGSNLTSADPTAVLYDNGFTGDGAVYAGLGCLGAYKANGATGTKEWATTQLTTPLMVDSCYTVSFRIQNKKNQINFPMATNQWGVFFDNTATPGFNPNTLNFASVPDQWVSTTTLIDDTIWHDIQLTYVANAAYTHMHVGYVGDPANAVENAWSQSASVGFYVWIDEVSVVQQTGCFICPIGITGTTSANEICGGTDGSITVTATGPNPLTYYLYDDLTSTIIDSNFTGVFSGLDAGDYSVHVSDLICSDSTATITLIDEMILPDPGTSSTAIICSDAIPVDLNNYLGGNPTPGGVWTPTTNAGGSIFNPLLDPAGVYTYTVTNTCGSSTATMNMIILAGNDPTITDPGPLCELNGTVTLTAATAGGTWSGANVNASGVFDPAAAGQGSHQVIYTSSGSCNYDDTIMVTVIASDAVTLDYTASTFCSSDPNPTANVTGATGNFTMTPSGTISGTGEIDLAATGAGTYMVYYTSTGSCPAVDSFEVIITDQINVDITAAGPFCLDDPMVTLNATPAGGTWSGNLNTATGEFTPFSAGVGSWDIIYTVTGACGDSDTITIVVNDLPTADAGVDVTISQGGFVMLNGSGGTVYSWDPPEGLSADDIQNPIATPDMTTLYELTVTDANGCVDIDYVEVTIETVVEQSDIFIPSMFSPNGDSHNDAFVIEGTGLNEFEVKIFNRWGEMVFTSTDQSISWEGLQNGKELNTGVYTYMVTYTDNIGVNQTLSGNVTLVK